jgi:hypothetical protein
MTDIDDKRVSGDTLSHLLLLTSEPGAVFMRLPQFFALQFIHPNYIGSPLPL